MFGIGRNGAKKHLSSMVNGIRFHLFCSKADELVVHFMVNSLGFSTKEAISTSAKVTRSRLRNYEPLLLLDLFHKIGLNKSQIKTLVSSSPKLLFCDIDTTLKPKIKGLQPLNLSGSDLVTLIEKSDFLRRGLHTSIKPTLDYLRELLGTHDAVAMVLKKEPRLISQNISKVLPPNIALLQNLGFSQIDIANFFQRYPRCLLRNPVCLQRVVHQAEEIFDIPRGSRMFLHGIAALVPLHESTLERKIDIYRSFGWSHSDICTMVRKLPSCFDFIRG
uniref:Uncharacterized protein n=1 Tax=Solanum tuberosum TaxID=4113 RepID=M1A755_SOLTU